MVYFPSKQSGWCQAAFLENPQLQLVDAMEKRTAIIFVHRELPKMKISYEGLIRRQNPFTKNSAFTMILSHASLLK